MFRPSAFLLLFGLTLALGPGSSFAADRGEPSRLERVLRMYADHRARSFPGVAEVSVEQARAWADSAEVVWLDVRTERERKISAIEGAIDERTFSATPHRWAGRVVIVYCTVGHRSGLATRELRAAGFEAFNLAGGVLAWIHAGGALVDGRSGEPTRTVHVYGPRWNLVPAGWRSVW